MNPPLNLSNLTCPLNIIFNDFIHNMISTNTLTNWIFITDPIDDNHVQSIDISINKIPNMYEIKICYQDEDIYDHGVYSGKYFYTNQIINFPNCILDSKYDNIHIHLNQIINNFFKT